MAVIFFVVSVLGTVIDGILRTLGRPRRTIFESERELAKD